MKLVLILIMSMILCGGCNGNNDTIDTRTKVTESNTDAITEVTESSTDAKVEVVESNINQSITAKEAAELGILADTEVYVRYNADGSKKSLVGWIIRGLVTDLGTAPQYKGKYTTGGYECELYKDDIDKLVLPAYIDGQPVISIDSGRCLDQVLAYGDGFKGCKKLKELVLPETLESIGVEAFAGESIEKIYVPSKVSNIDSMTFLKCTNLKEIVISENNENYSFKDGAIYNKDGTIMYEYIDGLEELKIGDKVEKICFLIDSEEYTGESYCYRGKNIKNIIVEPGNKNYFAIDGVLFNKDKTRLLYYPEKRGLESYDIPEGTKEIASLAFWGVKDLKNVNIPGSVKKIYKDAFCHNEFQQEIDNSLKFAEKNKSDTTDVVEYKR